jgi:predicted RNA-binding Zn ribbon-like protein
VTTDQTSSSGRLGLPLAPAGLCLVQDLLNTAGLAVAPSPVDLLDDAVTAQTWLTHSLQTWGEQTGQATPEITVTDSDLPSLRALRRNVRSRLTGTDDEAEQPLTAAVASRGARLTYQPRGRGAAAVASLVHLEALLASHSGTLARLKLCANPACGAAFYDQSRNSSRVWHDMKICGNAINLRTSRARRRGVAATEAPDPGQPGGAGRSARAL